MPGFSIRQLIFGFLFRLYLAKIVSDVLDVLNRFFGVNAAFNQDQLATKKAHAEFLRKLVEVPSNTVLSQASLETLAIIAYRQPVTRMEVDEVRGVQTDGPIRTLVAKGLVTDKGRVDGAGRAKLYVTTSEFLDAFGLNSLEDLPKLADPATDEPDQNEMDLFFDRFNQSKEQEEE